MREPIFETAAHLREPIFETAAQAEKKTATQRWEEKKRIGSYWNTTGPNFLNVTYPTTSTYSSAANIPSITWNEE